jgi:hypothetical protein
MDFAEALKSVEFSEGKRVFLKPLMMQEIKAVKKEIENSMMRGNHGMIKL